VTALAVLLLAAEAKATMNLSISSPPSSLKPGEKFTVTVTIDVELTRNLGYYNLPITYDHSVLTLIRAQGGTAEFAAPIFDDLAFAGSMWLRDQNNFLNGCTNFSRGAVPVAQLTFQVKESAPPAFNATIAFAATGVELNNCSGASIAGSLPPPDSWLPSFPVTNGLQLGAGNVDKFMDLNSDTDGTESDAILFHKLLSNDILSGEESLLGLNGRQCDINGNAISDLYDAGRFDALVRPARFISAGPNGICQSLALLDDVQELAVNQGTPYALIIGPGSDAILESAAVGDDTWFGQYITAGPNGIADSTALGNDTQIIAFGSGALNAICVSPGPNFQLNSIATGDDMAREDQRSYGAMLTAHPQQGVPDHLVVVAPSQDPSYLDGIRPVPVTVMVVDKNGRPMTGLSPTFRVVDGAGTFSNGQGGTNTLSNLETDTFALRADTPRGQTTAVFTPGPDRNTIQVGLTGDPTKGLPDLAPVNFQIFVLNQGILQPDVLQASLSPATIMAGTTSQMSVQLRDGAVPMNGAASRLMFLSNRNLKRGAGPAGLGQDRLQAIFFDDFESGNFTPAGQAAWLQNPGTGNLAVNNQQPGLFGTYSARAIDTGLVPPYIYRLINTADFEDIQVAFQWAFRAHATNPSYAVHFKVEYSKDGTTWRLLRDITGLEGFAGGNGHWSSTRISLKGVSAVNNSSLYLKFTFDVSNGASYPQTLFLDNVSVSGVRILYQENFEPYAKGDFPASLDPAVFVTTGPDGVLQTVSLIDDVAIFPFGKGQPNVAYIYPGPNGARDTTPAGDDQALPDKSITTGADGIANTTAAGDDYQEIALGQGKPFSLGVQPGADLFIDSIIGGDDQLVGALGPNPRVAVDDTVGADITLGQGNNGSAKFLFIGRSAPGATLGNYAAQLMLDLSGRSLATLSFYSRTLSQVDLALADRPAQEFVVEVSDNGGKSWVKVWDNAGQEESSWTNHEITLGNDPRFNLAADFMIRWRATMDGSEGNITDRDAVYLDDIKITALDPLPDQFGPVSDTGTNGQYQVGYSSLVPGNTVALATVYYPTTVSASAGNLPVFSAPVGAVVQPLKAERGSIRVLPNAFTLHACDSLPIMVVGRLTATPPGQVVDLTRFFKLLVNGPARQTATGMITADCFDGATPEDITVSAWPLVSGLYDPSGGGSGVQTGDISGRIYRPNLSAAPNAPVWIDLGGGVKKFVHADSSGWYLLQALPAGTNYTLESSLNGFTKKTRTAVAVSAGVNTAINLTLLNGTNFDGDGTADASDTDKDNDGVLNTAESVTAAATDPDYDNDGIPDNQDAFPNNAAETVDADGDGTGNNADTDDDNDGILDTEEVIPGADGYITNPLVADTDGDGMPDGWETNSYNGLNPTANDAAGDLDSDGLNNLAEYTHGTRANDSDTEDDGMADGYEVTNGLNPLADDAAGDLDGDGLTNLTEYGAGSAANHWDTDGDALPDKFEYDNRTGHASNLDLLSAADGALDYDSDGNPNVHEYWNGTDPWTPDPVGFAACGYWAEADGDGFITPIDKGALVQMAKGLAYSYANVLPSTGETQDLDTDGFLTPVDVSLMSAMVKGVGTAALPSRPASLTVVSSCLPSVAVGDTCHVTLSVVNSAAPATKQGGISVIFSVDPSSTGTATILGGEGADSGQRYDLSGTALSGPGGLSTVVVRPDSVGTVKISARIPQCGDIMNYGRSSPEILLNNFATITVY